MLLPHLGFTFDLRIKRNKAQWMEHWMEDHMLGVGHNKDWDGLGLLQQQLHHAQMEAWLLEIALNQSKSSRH